MKTNQKTPQDLKRIRATTHLKWIGAPTKTRSMPPLGIECDMRARFNRNDKHTSQTKMAVGCEMARTNVSRQLALPCRLCGGAASLQFTTMILYKYNVTFYRCSSCHSLQTEAPYWLDESYRDSRRPLDVGAALRVQELQMLTFFVCRIFGLLRSGSLLDCGSGDGLFVRMMRDRGINAFYWDPLATNNYAIGFEGKPSERHNMVTAFEVWEHLVDPSKDIPRMLEGNPDIHFATTSMYRNQGPEWSYLNCATGRHVFFYSEKAIEAIANMFGYSYKIYDNKYILLFRHQLSVLSRWWLDQIFSKRRRAWLRAYYAFSKKNSLVDADRKLVQSLSKSGNLLRSD